MSERKCSDCYFWRARINERYSGWCHRFPEMHEKNSYDWCGEWRERERDPMDVTQR